MIIREYEYEENRPFNCQQRFIKIDGDDPWERYMDLVVKENLLGHGPYNRFITPNAFILSKDEKAFAFRFEMNYETFVHVSQDWTYLFNEEPIVIEIKENNEYKYITNKED